MPKLQLPAFCLPFVTRSLRGGRKRRFAFFGGLFGLITLFLSFWIALGNGPFEHELRVSFDLEESEWVREHEEFIVIYHTDDEFEAFNYPGSIESRQQEARALLEAVVETPTSFRPNLELQREAAELLAHDRTVVPDYYDPYFHWGDESTIKRVRAIVDQKLQPQLVAYSSPLSVGDGFALMGILSGGLLLLLSFVFAPLAVGVQQAQEVHENTLQPLTGTALKPRELVLGLASGPLVVIGILALPQVGLLLLAGAANAAFLSVAGLLVVCLVGCAASCLVTQLLGHLAGRRRTPGIVGGFLLVVLGIVFSIGAAFGLNVEHEVSSALAVSPQGSAFFLLHEAFAAESLLSTYHSLGAAASIAVGTLGLVVASVLLLLVVERRVAGRDGPALTRSEAAVGALTAIVLALMTIPVWDDPWREETGALYYLFTLAMIAPAFAVLVMGRVPLGDIPPSLRRVSLRSIMAELGAALGIHLAIVLLLVRDDFGLGIFHPVAVLWLGWCVVVLALIAVRAVAYPVKVLSGVWLVFCGVALMVGYGHVVAWSMEASSMDAVDVFALANASPLLGLGQVVLTVWIPWSLLRALRKNLKQI
jgi:hypothetical protein